MCSHTGNKISKITYELELLWNLMMKFKINLIAILFTIIVLQGCSSTPTSSEPFIETLDVSLNPVEASLDEKGRLYRDIFSVLYRENVFEARPHPGQDHEHLVRTLA